MSAADRMRRLRARRATGRIVVDVEADEIPLVERLIAGGFLRPELADSPLAIKDALERLVSNIVVADVHGQ